VKRYLEDEILAIQERNIYETDEANKEEQQKKNIFKPLPEAEYRFKNRKYLLTLSFF